MKCPHCNGEHPDGYKFCPVTGKPIELKACTNKDCPDFGKRILPAEAKFCPRCGKPIKSESLSAQGNHPAKSKLSQIVVTCSQANVSIYIGSHNKRKQVKLKQGENILTVKDYPALKYGFYFIEGCNQERIRMIDLSSYDTSNVTDMRCMFDGCSSLESLDLSGFDTSNVTNMQSMFYGCSSLESLDLSGFDTSNVTDMSSMLEGCSSLESLDLSGFDTSNVTNMLSMFDGCSKKIQDEYEYLTR